MRNPWVVIGVIAVLLIVGAVWYSSAAAKSYNEGVTITSHIKGNASSTVTLVEYSDFQCPACAQFEPVVAEVLEQYGADIAFEYRHFPLSQIHPFAESAARAAEAAGQQGKFFEFHDLLFKNQEKWVSSGTPTMYYLQYAKELGLDIDQFTRQQRSSIIRAHVVSQFDEARKQGFTGTPSFVLNGKKMEIANYDDFRAQIAAAVGRGVVVQSASSTGSSTTELAVPASDVKFGL